LVPVEKVMGSRWGSKIPRFFQPVSIVRRGHVPVIMVQNHARRLKANPNRTHPGIEKQEIRLILPTRFFILEYKPKIK